MSAKKLKRKIKIENGEVSEEMESSEQVQPKEKTKESVEEGLDTLGSEELEDLDVKSESPNEEDVSPLEKSRSSSSRKSR